VGAAALPLPLNIATCFAVTLCCAAISWHLVEHPARTSARLLIWING
jgi:peptidoglycan/LPS O-acetylase OafA/YrhL